MVCAPVRSIIPELYLSVQAHKPCSISHLSLRISGMTNQVNDNANQLYNSNKMNCDITKISLILISQRARVGRPQTR